LAVEVTLNSSLLGRIILISSVIELPGCHTQAKTYDELNKRTKEAIALYLEENKRYKPIGKFLSLQQLSL